MRRLNIFFLALFVCVNFLQAQIAEVLPSDELLQREFGAHDRTSFLSAVKGVNQAVTRFTPFFTPKN